MKRVLPLSTRVCRLARPFERYGRQTSRRKRGLTDLSQASRSITQSGSVGFMSIVGMVSGLVAILGLVKAAHSEQPLFWLAVWPAPVTLAYIVFIFFREGFHFEDGVLVLGRRRN
jgi:uncharacterized membrane protein